MNSPNRSSARDDDRTPGHCVDDGRHNQGYRQHQLHGQYHEEASAGGWGVARHVKERHDVQDRDDDERADEDRRTVPKIFGCSHSEDDQACHGDHHQDAEPTQLLEAFPLPFEVPDPGKADPDRPDKQGHQEATQQIQGVQVARYRIGDLNQTKDERQIEVQLSRHVAGRMCLGLVIGHRLARSINHGIEIKPQSGEGQRQNGSWPPTATSLASPSRRTLGP